MSNLYTGDCSIFMALMLKRHRRVFISVLCPFPPPGCATTTVKYCYRQSSVSMQMMYSSPPVM